MIYETKKEKLLFFIQVNRKFTAVAYYRHLNISLSLEI